VEETLEVPYRYHKTFTGLYTSAGGRSDERTFGLFVRDLDKGVETHVDPMGEYLWQTGLYKGYRPGEGNGLRTVEATLLFDATANVIKAGKAEEMLYHIGPRND
jgi:aminoglycoside 3-N-acetyltransferase